MNPPEKERDTPEAETGPHRIRWTQGSLASTNTLRLVPRRPVTEWPEQVIGRESPVRGEYLQAIRAADEGDYEPLFELHRRFTASG